MNKLKDLFKNEYRIIREASSLPGEFSSLDDVNDLCEILRKYYESIINIKEGLLSYISEAQTKRSSKYLRKEAVDRLDSVLRDYIHKLSDIIYRLDRYLEHDISILYDIEHVKMSNLRYVLRNSLYLVEEIRDFFARIIPLVEWGEHRHIALYLSGSMKRIVYRILDIKYDISELSYMNSKLLDIEEKLSNIQSRISKLCPEYDLLSEIPEVPVRIDEYLQEAPNIFSDLLNVIAELYEELIKMVEEHIEKYKAREKVYVSA